MTAARLGGAWGGGLLAAALLDEIWLLVALPLYALAVVALLLGRLSAAEAFLLPAMFLLAALRYDWSRPGPDPNSVAAYAGLKRAIAEGVVIGEPEPRPGGQRFRLRAGKAFGPSGWVAVNGDLLVYTDYFADYRRGDRLELEGRLRIPQSGGEFDYRAFLLRRGIVAEIFFPRTERLGGEPVAWPSRLLFSLRSGIGARLDRTLSPTEAALARGILVGGSGLPVRLNEELRASNLSHLVVVSGYNITLVAGLTVAGLAWLIGRRRAIVVGIGIAMLYALAVGLAPPVTRALVMTALALLAGLLGRPGSSVTALLLAAAVLTLFDPQVIHEPSFQLSFAATAGLVIAAVPIERALLPRDSRHTILRMLAETAGVTIAAMLATLPVQVHHFGRWSPAGLPANLLVVPAFPLMLVSSAFTVALGAISEPLARTAGSVLELPFTWLALVARTFAGAPMGEISAGRHAAFVGLGLYALTGLLILLVRRGLVVPPARLRPGRRLEAAALAAAAVAAVSLWAALLWPRGERASLAVLPVSGSGLVLQDEASHAVLIDGGNDGRRLVEQLGRLLPRGARRLDLVVFTSSRPGQIGALPAVLERYEVGRVVLPPGPARTATERFVRRLLEAEGVPIEPGVAGLKADLTGASLLVTAVATGERDRHGGLTLELTLGDARFTLPGDVPDERLASYLAGQAGILVAPAERLSLQLLDLTNPAAVLVLDGDEADEGALSGRDELPVWRAAPGERLTFVPHARGLALAVLH